MVGLYAVRAVLAAALGWAAYRLGSRVAGEPGPRRSAWALVGVVSALVGVALEVPECPVYLGPGLGPCAVLAGGGVVYAITGALLLLGIVAHAPERARRAIRPLFLRALLAAAVFAEASALLGFLWWPRHPSRGNYPGRDGLVQQSTGTSCTAAAGAMLLDRHGLLISEGEVATLANTSPLFGTSHDALALGLTLGLRRHGWRARARLLNWDRLVALRQPVVLGVYLPAVRIWHSVLIEQADARGALVADPLTADRQRRTRAELEQAWWPVAVWLERR
jgi:hypothetical protein